MYDAISSPQTSQLSTSPLYSCGTSSSPLDRLPLRSRRFVRRQAQAALTYLTPVEPTTEGIKDHVNTELSDITFHPHPSLPDRYWGLSSDPSDVSLIKNSTRPTVPSDIDIRAVGGSPDDPHELELLLDLLVQLEAAKLGVATDPGPRALSTASLQSNPPTQPCSSLSPQASSSNSPLHHPHSLFLGTIHQLPTELLNMIFEYLLPQPQPSTTAQYYTQLNCLRLVHPFWNNLITAQPSFWTVISSAQSPLSLILSLQRSDNRSLVIYCRPQCGGTPINTDQDDPLTLSEFLGIVVEYKRRWCIFDAKMPQLNLLPFIEALTNQEPAACLKILRISMEGHMSSEAPFAHTTDFSFQLHEAFGLHAQESPIEVLEFRDIAISWEPPLPWKLQDIKIGSGVQVSLPLLASALLAIPNLLSMELDNVTGSVVLGDDLEAYYSMQIPLPALQRLILIEEKTKEDLLPFSCLIQAPTCRQLVLRFDLEVYEPVQQEQLFKQLPKLLPPVLTQTRKNSHTKLELGTNLCWSTDGPSDDGNCPHVRIVLGQAILGSNQCPLNCITGCLAAMPPCSSVGVHLFDAFKQSSRYSVIGPVMKTWEITELRTEIDDFALGLLIDLLTPSETMPLAKLRRLDIRSLPNDIAPDADVEGDLSALVDILSTRASRSATEAIRPVPAFHLVLSGQHSVFSDRHLDLIRKGSSSWIKFDLSEASVDLIDPGALLW